jgi:hypothetical protein
MKLHFYFFFSTVSYKKNRTRRFAMRLTGANFTEFQPQNPNGESKMTYAEIETAIANITNGANIKIETERPCHLYKKYEGMPVTKKSSYTARIGVDYDRQEPVIEARESGELPAENQGLKGMEWKQFPFLLKSTKNERYFLRVTGSSFRHPAKSAYYVDGREVKREDIAHMLTARENPREAKPGAVWNVGIETVTRLHRDYAADHREVDAQVEEMA